MTIYHKNKAGLRKAMKEKQKEEVVIETRRAPRMHKCLQAYLDTIREDTSARK